MGGGSPYAPLDETGGEEARARRSCLAAGASSGLLLDMDLDPCQQHIGFQESCHKPDLVDRSFEEEAGRFDVTALGEIALPIPAFLAQAARLDQ